MASKCALRPLGPQIVEDTNHQVLLEDGPRPADISGGQLTTCKMSARSEESTVVVKDGEDGSGTGQLELTSETEAVEQPVEPEDGKGASGSVDEHDASEYQHVFQESVWDASLFIFTAPMGTGGSFLSLLLLFINIVMQVLYTGIVATEFTASNFGQDAVAGHTHPHMMRPGGAQVSDRKRPWFLTFCCTSIEALASPKFAKSICWCLCKLRVYLILSGRYQI